MASVDADLARLRESCLELARGFAALHAQYALTCATAESLTGGLIADLLVTVPGSSAWFDCALVTYSNASKRRLLGVEEMVLERHGAVSGQCALQMVSGVIAASQADVAVAVTGIAGPDGGSALKPVGTVWLGCQRRGCAPVALRFVFAGNRGAIRLQTAYAALEALALLFKSAKVEGLEGYLGDKSLEIMPGQGG